MDDTPASETTSHWTTRDTLTVQQAADILGLGRSAAYEAVRRKEIPSLRVGSRIVVPVPLLKSLLGYTQTGM